MPEKLPGLPAFLTQPLSCPPHRCQHPGEPLPSIPTELASLLPEWLIVRLANGVRDACIMTEPVDTILDAMIVQHLRRGPTPAQLAQRYPGIVAMTAPSKASDPDICDYIARVAAPQLAATTADLFQYFFEDDPEKGCLHTFLDPAHIKRWRYLSDNPYPFTQDRSQPDLRALLDRISAGIDWRELNDSTWGTREEWQREITRTRLGYARMRSEDWARGAGRGSSRSDIELRWSGRAQY